MSRSGCLVLICGFALAACGQPGGDADQDAAANEVLPATESYRDFGQYTLHFNALTTDQLTEAIASEYQIVRSRNSALLNVSILLNRDVGLPTAVPGDVRASARNLTGQFRNLDVREIREGDAIYYIAETDIVNAESLVFTVEATPESESEPMRVSFQKQFFVAQ